MREWVPVRICSTAELLPQRLFWIHVWWKRSCWLWSIRDSKGKCSGMLWWMVMVFLFEEKQSSCLHNKASWCGMRYVCVVCEQCYLASSLSPRKVALVPFFFFVCVYYFCIVQWILYFCLCCNLCNTQIYSPIPLWSSTSRNWHHTNSHVREV